MSKAKSKTIRAKAKKPAHDIVPSLKFAEEVAGKAIRKKWRLIGRPHTFRQLKNAILAENMAIIPRLMAANVSVSEAIALNRKFAALRTKPVDEHNLERNIPGQARRACAVGCAIYACAREARTLAETADRLEFFSKWNNFVAFEYGPAAMLQSANEVRRIGRTAP